MRQTKKAVADRQRKHMANSDAKRAEGEFQDAGGAEDSFQAVSQEAGFFPPVHGDDFSSFGRMRNASITGSIAVSPRLRAMMITGPSVMKMSAPMNFGRHTSTASKARRLVDYDSSADEDEVCREDDFNFDDSEKINRARPRRAH